MTNGENVREDRLKKLDILKNAGMDPYPARILRDMSVADYLEQFKKHEEMKDSVTLAGRIMRSEEHTSELQSR